MYDVKRVAIVGGGPSGVAAAKYLSAERYFEKIDIFEQRHTVGGVWNYTPENDAATSLQIPQTSPNIGLEKPFWKVVDNGRETIESQSQSSATFASPMYERLEANLPKMLMQHSGAPFADEDQLFPKLETIAKYLEQYAHDVRQMIEFETQVEQIERRHLGLKSTWSITTQDLKSAARQTREYDAVVVASGHYTVPFIPDIKGISEWNKHYPGCITHSKFFRRPEDFKDKKVLIIGNGPSGTDIAAQLLNYCSQPLLVSTRSPATPISDNHKALPVIKEFLPPSTNKGRRPRAVRFANYHTEAYLDAVIFCTGYLYSFPFLPASPCPGVPLITDGARTLNVYQHIFYTGDPTLAFLALPWNIVPFPVAEAQSAAIARVWSGRLTLPSVEGMEHWGNEVVKEMGLTGDGGKAFHKLAPPRDVNYINFLHDWCATADRQLTDSTANEDQASHGQIAAVGKTPPYWGARERWMRMNVPEFKRTFAQMGESRHKVRRLEELGFHFNSSRSENTPATLMDRKMDNT